MFRYQHQSRLRNLPQREEGDPKEEAESSPKLCHEGDKVVEVFLLLLGHLAVHHHELETLNIILE